MHYPCQPYFFAKNAGGLCKKREGVDQEKKYFSHIYILRTNIHMYKTKHALIQYFFSPFQSCITLNCQYMVTYRKYHSKCVDGVRSPSFFRLKNLGVDVKNGRGLTRKKKYFSHIHIIWTNIHMYKTKHALINYCWSPFQSCITLNCQYMGTYFKDHSKYVDVDRHP